MGILNKQLIEYCERTNHALLAEPLNLFSNLAFIIVAGIILRPYLQSKTRVPANLNVSLWLIIAVGIGSMLFHSFATLWAKALDVIPIGLLVLYLVQSVKSELEQLNPNEKDKYFWWRFIVLTLVLGALIPKDIVSGSNWYLGTAAFLLDLWRRSHNYLTENQSRLIKYCGMAFVFALIFRSLDSFACGALPTGTHFLWHIFCALTLFYGIKLLQNLSKAQIDK